PYRGGAQGWHHTPQPRRAGRPIFGQDLRHRFAARFAVGAQVTAEQQNVLGFSLSPVQSLTDFRAAAEEPSGGRRC
ncbi:hypothetical protein, partial [Nostoc sp. CHAB 5715]|uniref:hypothetical protein n=1 Tax=Nostoc sp. CHAB 5715 TaxID=2780400 RepID=UPI001E552AF4